jgi:hypothetical protein
MKRVSFSVLLWLITSFISTGYATIIPGSGNTFLQVEADLTWVQPAQFRQYTISDILSNILPNTYPGYRLATPTEMQSLYNDLTSNYFSSTQNNYSTWESLIGSATAGQFQSGNEFDYWIGVSQDSDPGNTYLGKTTISLSALIRKYCDVLYYAANFSQHKISEESFERIL